MNCYHLDQETALVDLVSFKWLMAGRGWWVDLPRLEKDVSYAQDVRAARRRQRPRASEATQHGSAGCLEAHRQLIMTADDVLLVIGAGHAGVELAVQARESGWPGRIVLVGDETALPYHRPPLSKAYLAGEAPLDSLALRARTTYEKAGVELLLGRRVERIDRAASQVSFHDGSRLGYTRLALATGGRPRRLPAAADGAEQADNFHYLRALGDVDFIRKWFERGHTAGDRRRRLHRPRSGGGGGQGRTEGRGAGSRVARARAGDGAAGVVFLRAGAPRGGRGPANRRRGGRLHARRESPAGDRSALQ